MIKRFAQAWGIAAILLLPSYVDLTSSFGDEQMHVPFPLTRFALAQLCDLAIVALVFAGLMAILRRRKSWAQIRWFLLASLPVYALVCNLSNFPYYVPFTVLLAAGAAWFALLAFLVFRAPSIASAFYRFCSAVLTGIAIFALVISVQLVRAACWHPGPQAYASTIPAQPASKPRLVWILFDELAYKPVFETRDASLSLPNFDRLRSRSTLYTDVTPIDYHTDVVVPSLLLGRVLRGATYTASKQYLVRTSDSPHWQPFDVNASLFGLAKQHGVTTSVAGWYIPYCPIFAGTVTECYWSNDDTEAGDAPSFNDSFAENAWFPLRTLAEELVAPPKALADVARWKSLSHAASARDISQHAFTALATSHADVIYLHFPAPHPPPFWDRNTHTFAAGGSYLDALDYSDRLLGQILDVLQAQPRWPATTLIVQGDHSWRTHIWRTLPGWSTEDERISHGGQWDPRPVLLIHMAGQQSPETVTASTSLMFVHGFAASQIQALAR
ncbi:MAG: sulfatase-like hydrolase/transferase [Terracidiphilus sp.]|jgi:hypothetical protein